LYEWIYAIQKLIDFIDDNAVNNPSLEEISRQVGYSPYYCSVQFHKNNQSGYFKEYPLLSLICQRENLNDIR